MSTPHVSGVAALLLETDSSLTPSDVKKALKSTALDLGLDENTQGSGRVDAYEAYLSIANTTTEEPNNETDSGNETEEPEDDEEKKSPPGWDRKLERGKNPQGIGYGLTRAWEKISLAFTFNDEKKAELYLKFAERRLSESLEVLEEDEEKAKELLEEYEENLERGTEISRIAQQVGKNTTKVSELVAVATSIHRDVLEDVLERVPEQAKPSIQRAITSSKKGNEESLNTLEKSQPEKAAEIHFRIAEKRLAKAQEKVEEGEFEDVDDIIEEYEEKMGEASRTAEIAKGIGNNTTDVEQVIAEATSKHLEILEEVHKKVPEQAKKSIEKSMEVSANGREKAVESLKEKDSLGEIPEEVDIPVEIPKTPSSGSEDSGSGSGSGAGSSGSASTGAGPSTGSEASSGRRP